MCGPVTHEKWVHYKQDLAFRKNRKSYFPVFEVGISLWEFALHNRCVYASCQMAKTKILSNANYGQATTARRLKSPPWVEFTKLSQALPEPDSVRIKNDAISRYHTIPYLSLLYPMLYDTIPNDTIRYDTTAHLSPLFDQSSSWSMNPHLPSPNSPCSSSTSSFCSSSTSSTSSFCSSSCSSCYCLSSSSSSSTLHYHTC